MKLFTLDSPEDLICRGFLQSQIFEKTGIDVGYNGSKFKTELKGIDRKEYKLQFVKTNVGLEKYEQALDEYSKGASKDEILNILGINNANLIKLSWLFSELGLRDAFAKIDAKRRQDNMKNGIKEKYGVDNVFEMSDVITKAVKTRKQNKIDNSFLPEKQRIKELEQEIENLEKFIRSTRLKTYNLTKDEARKLKVEYEFEKYELEKKILLSTVDTVYKKDGFIDAAVNFKPIHTTPAIRETRSGDESGFPPEFDPRVKDEKGHWRTDVWENHRAIKSMLISHFGEDDVVENYIDERYPLGSKFYVKSKDLFIEYFMSNLKYSRHWFDKNNPEDVNFAKELKGSKHKVLNDNYIEWTKTNVQKRKDAKKHKLNYMVFWDNQRCFDAYLAYCLDYPQSQDWKIEGSWIPYRKITNPEYPLPELSDTNGTCVAIAKYFNKLPFYHREIEMWNKNEPTLRGRLQIDLYSNRNFYIQRRWYDLADKEILRGLGISKSLIAYSVYFNDGLTAVLNKYNINSWTDTSCGWGEKIATACARNSYFIGCDINSALKPGYEALLEKFGTGRQSFSVDDSTTFDIKSKMNELGLSEIDAYISCIPYGFVEIYDSNDPRAADSMETDEEFLEWWDKTVKNASSVNPKYFCYQINQLWKERTMEIVKNNGWKLIDEIKVKEASASHVHRKGKNSENKKGQYNGITKTEFEEMLVFTR